MPTAPSIPDTCPHERRPGLTVCLHCRHAAREEEAARRRRTLSRAALVAGAVVIGVTIGHAALRAPEATALAAAIARATSASGTGDSAASANVTSASATIASATSATVTDGGATSPRATDAGVTSATAALPPLASTPTLTVASLDPSAPERAPSFPPAPAHEAPAPDSAASAPSGDAAPLAPIVPAGRSDLVEGMSVVRSGDSVTVHFDTELGRTRRPEKFERIVRTTVAAVYGARGAELLAGVPEGAIAGAGELLGELPARGVRLPAGDGWTLLVRPETRPGRDGPLVVRYIATVER